MSKPYTTQTITGFNSSPPSDDGSQVSTNEITWSNHVDKLGTPCKNFGEAMNTELLSAFGLVFGQNISSHATDYTVVAGDQGKFLDVTGTTTITLLAAATAGANFVLAIINNGTGVVTVDGNGAETINGSATITLNPGNSLVLTCNATLWIGHIGLGDQSVKTVGVASAVNEITVTNAATGNGPDISATGDDTNIDLNLSSKGTGVLNFNGSDISTKPAFSVHKNGTDQLNITGAQKITWSTEEFDTNSNFASSTFTPTIVGKYFFEINIAWVNGTVTDSDEIRIYIYKNGAVHKEKLTVARTSFGHTEDMQISSTIDMNGSTDNVDIYVQNVTRDTSDVDGQAIRTWFTGFKID